MGKLGKKARKFAKKNLQSVLRNRRKFKSRRDSFKKRTASVDKEESPEVHDTPITDRHAEGAKTGINVYGAGDNNSFIDILISEDEDNTIQDMSDSDGYLSEDPDCPYISESEKENDFEEDRYATSIGQNSALHVALAKQKKRIDRLKKKDIKFSEFLERHQDALELLKNGEPCSDEDERSYKSQAINIDLLGQEGKLITCLTVDVWSWLVIEQVHVPAMLSLLNSYRTVCQYWADDTVEISRHRIPTKEVFSKIMMFVLDEADGIFRRILKTPDLCSRENILKLKTTSHWKIARPMIKSYLRSTLFLLNQLTDNQIIAFTLSRLRDSIIFFVAFPSLIGRLIKIAVHLWVTGDGTLSSLSFLIIKEMMLLLSTDCHETCLLRTYSAFIKCCKFVEPTNFRHIEYLGDSIVELYSLDVQKSCQKVLISLQHLTSTLQLALRTKKKAELKKISSWQYTKCIDIWVKYIACNIKYYDLHPLLYSVIQIIRGMAHLFPGPRYLPLKLKCVKMLNQLSASSGVFIPVVYLVLDFLEYGGSSSKIDSRPGNVNFSYVLKAPKQWLKSQQFKEECILCAIELISAHFSQWSCHVSFPDLATIPLILLKRFYEKVTTENIRRPVKRLIKQVQQNSEFVQRKRDEVTFSPNDQASIDSYFEFEKNSGNAVFALYYKNVQDKSLSRARGAIL